jgi:thiopeptide-type bacteriocin biosynthesis protein
VVIPAPPTLQEQVLSALADVATDVAGQFDLWFWLRYRDDAHGPHLRARFHGNPCALTGQVLSALSRCCDDLIRARVAGGMSIEPYDQETERYGGCHAINVAERVFGADSSLVLTTIAEALDNDTRIVIAALSAAAIAQTVADGSRAALQHGGLDRPARRRVAALRPLARKAADTGPTAYIPALQAVWEDRGRALKAYHDAVSVQRRPDCASSVIHMHANRLLGDLDGERIARALAIDLLARDQPR